jgi:hypothetical protein
VQAGSMEGSKFCLFLVALPARCVSSISPRFHFRTHTFCFLLLATILETPASNKILVTSVWNIKRSRVAYNIQKKYGTSTQFQDLA